MAAAARKHDDLVLRRIDIKKWSSPVAKQFNVRSLPSFMLFDTSGKLVMQGSKVYGRVMKWKPAKKVATKKGSSKSGVGTVASRRSPAGGLGDNPPERKKRIRQVSKRGERVDFESELAKGSYTLFEFYADWCTDSGKRAPELQSAVKRTNDLVLCRIRVTSVRSPVMRQHRVKSVPHFVLFDPKGELVKEGPDVIEDVLNWKRFKAAARPPK